MARLRLFGPLADAAGTRSDDIDGADVDAVIAAAGARYGGAFPAIVATCRVWVNGESATGRTPVGDDDEVALLPPVSGGAR
jgi:sulfur-carrier protein